MENYTYRARDNHDYNVFIKTICNPRVVIGFSTVHSPTYEQGYYNISEKGSYIPSLVFYDSIGGRLRKSEKEYFNKMKRGWSDVSYKELIEEQIVAKIREASVEFNEVHDPIMNCYICELKERVCIL